MRFIRKPILPGRLKVFLRPPTPYYEERDMPRDPERLGRIEEDARLANYPYHRNITRLPEGWVPSNRLVDAISRDMGLADQQGVEYRNGTLVDNKSGLTATVLANPARREVVAAFGGTTSGRKVGTHLAARFQPGKNARTSLSQWGTNVKAGLGRTPRSYAQAAELVARLQENIRTRPEYQGYRLRTVGHSKGGGEATYAALRQAEPVPATVFCPWHLSDGLLRQLPTANLDRAKTLVQSYAPYGDPVAALRGSLPGIHGVGREFRFEGIKGSNPIDLHDQFLKHLVHYCERARRA
jgi:hypothetical protein